jgi:hypothetical protein
VSVGASERVCAGTQAGSLVDVLGPARHCFNTPVGGVASGWRRLSSIRVVVGTGAPEIGTGHLGRRGPRYRFEPPGRSIGVELALRLVDRRPGADECTASSVCADRLTPGACHGPQEGQATGSRTGE